MDSGTMNKRTKVFADKEGEGLVVGKEVIIKFTGAEKVRANIVRILATGMEIDCKECISGEREDFPLALGLMDVYWSEIFSVHELPPSLTNGETCFGLRG